MTVKHPKWRRLFRWSVPFLIVLLMPLGYWGYQWQRGNIHTITPGQAYRSATLDDERLAKTLAEYDIRSVINLRTANESAEWYRRELALCEQLGVEHRTLSLTAYEGPTPQQVTGLLELFETLPRPVLIHCRAGADRTGLASAMWRLWVDGATREEAKEQLSFWYGHMPIGSTRALDHFFETWTPLNPSNGGEDEGAMTPASTVP